MQITSKVICNLLGVPYEHCATSKRRGKTMSDLTSTPEQALGTVSSIDDDMAEEVLRNLRPGARSTGCSAVCRSPPDRIPVEDVQDGPHSFHAGDRLVTSFLAANWSTAVTQDPKRLDVRRKFSAHLAFGHGPHGCPGQHPARLEIGFAVPALLRGFRAQLPLSRNWTPVRH